MCVIFSRVTRISKYFYNRNHWAGPNYFVVQPSHILPVATMSKGQSTVLVVYLFQEVVGGRKKERKKKVKKVLVPHIPPTEYMLAYYSRHLLIAQSKEKSEKKWISDMSLCRYSFMGWCNLPFSCFSGISLGVLYWSTGIKNYLSTKPQIINHIRCSHLYSHCFEPSMK